MSDQIKDSKELLKFLNDKFKEALKLDHKIYHLRMLLQDKEKEYADVADEIMQELPIPLSGKDGLLNFNTSRDVTYYNNKEEHKVVQSECGPWGMDRTNISYSEILPMIIRKRDHITLDKIKKYLNKEDKK